MVNRPITALVTAVQKEWAGDSRNCQRHLTLQVSPVDDHASIGDVEAMVRGLENLTRTSTVALEEVLGVSILPTSRDLAVAGETSELRQKPIYCASGWQNTL